MLIICSLSDCRWSIAGVNWWSSINTQLHTKTSNTFSFMIRYIISHTHQSHLRLCFVIVMVNWPQWCQTQNIYVFFLCGPVTIDPYRSTARVFGTTAHSLWSPLLIRHVSDTRWTVWHNPGLGPALRCTCLYILAATTSTNDLKHHQSGQWYLNLFEYLVLCERVLWVREIRWIRKDVSLSNEILTLLSILGAARWLSG